MSFARLGVNIDHVATIRQARGTSYPSLVRAANLCIEAGAEQITIHLRGDRRHIQDDDVVPILKCCHDHQTLLNLELAAQASMTDLACQFKPDWVCIVPEREEEQTTEGGLNLLDKRVYTQVQLAVEKFRLKLPKTKISLFLAPNIELLPTIESLDIDAVEIHTGDYAHHFPNCDKELSYIKIFLEAINKLPVGLHAGHGLTNQSIVPLLELKMIEEYNIGHWIISQSLFDGLPKVVAELRKQIHTYPLIKRVK